MAKNLGTSAGEDSAAEEIPGTGIEDHTPQTWYYKYISAAEHTQVGAIFTPMVGEVEVDKIYAIVNPIVVSTLDGHPEWEKSTKRDYDAQQKESE